ncbi:hypothetical protein [Rhodocaloribacter sp.]
MNGTLTLHIEELVLDGFGPMDRTALADAVRAELARLMAERGLPPSLGAAAARLDAGAFTAAPNAGAHTLGTDVARAIYGDMNR